ANEDPTAWQLKTGGKNYPFERSRRFPEILANSSHRDYSLLSCGGGETQLGPNAGISAGFQGPLRRSRAPPPIEIAVTRSLLADCAYDARVGRASPWPGPSTTLRISSS